MAFFVCIELSAALMTGLLLLYGTVWRGCFFARKKNQYAANNYVAINAAHKSVFLLFARIFSPRVLETSACTVRGSSEISKPRSKERNVTKRYDAKALRLLVVRATASADLFTTASIRRRGKGSTVLHNIGPPGRTDKMRHGRYRRHL